LKIILTLKWFPMHLNFSEIPLTYGILTMPWYIVCEEGRLLLCDFIMESSEIFWIFIKHQIISYVLNFLVEILLILTNDWSNYEQLPFSRDVGGWTWSADYDLYE
jgi:hypothetical protein